MFGHTQQWYSILNKELKNNVCMAMFSPHFSDFPLEEKKRFSHELFIFIKIF